MLSTLLFIVAYFSFVLLFLLFFSFFSSSFFFFLYIFFGGGAGGQEAGSFVLFLRNFQKVPNVWYLIILKRADLRWNRRLEDMEQLTKLQDELLDAASM